MNKSKLNINKVLEVANSLGFANILGGVNENEIWVSQFWLPPGAHRISSRQINEQILINHSNKKNLKIEYSGWDNTKSPLVWRIEKQALNYSPDTFLIKIFENYQGCYVKTIQLLLFGPHFMDS